MREWRYLQTCAEWSLNNIFQKQTIPDLARWQIFHWVGSMPRLLLHVSCYCCWGVCTRLKTWMKIIWIRLVPHGTSMSQGMSRGCMQVSVLGGASEFETCVSARLQHVSLLELPGVRDGQTACVISLPCSHLMGNGGFLVVGLLSSASAPAGYTFHLSMPGILLLPAHFCSFLLFLLVFLVILITTGRQ